MIDLDQLDAQLERALTDDVRALRSSPPRPTFDRSAPPALNAGSSGPKTLAEKLASIDDDFDLPPRPVSRPRPQAPAPDRVAEAKEIDALDWLDPEPAPPAPAAPAPAPAPAAPAAVRPSRPAPAPPAPAPPEHRPSRPVSVTRITDAPFFEKRPSEVSPAASAGTDRAGTAPSPAAVSARERLRQAAVRQAHGLDDGAPGIGALTQRIPVLLAQGLLDDVDRDLADHATMASKLGSSDDRLAAASWKVMRAALDGRRDDARSALQVVHALGHAENRYWTQRLWLGLEWGDDEEHYALLSHCWERAYRFDDLAWRGALCLLLARMGRTDEASREVDAVLAALQGATPDGFADIVTNLAETVFLLGDATRAGSVQKMLAKVRDHMVVTGPGIVCKGALTRFSALVAATAGRAADADRLFSAAADTHRALGARPLLARNLREWGSTLAGRDDVRAQRCLAESAAIARELGLSEVKAPALAG